MTGLPGQITLLLWPWIAGAFGLGLAVGAATCSVAAPGRFGRIAAALACAAILALTAVAGFGLVPGRAGLWIELGLVFVATYGAGCAIGCLVRRVVRA